MFDDQIKEPEDIFAASEGPAQPAGVVQPSAPNQASRPVPTLTPAEDVVASGPSRTVVILAAVGVVLAVAIIGALVYVWMSRRSQELVAPVSQSPAVTAPPPSATQQPTLPIVPLPTTPEPEPVLPADTDKDGLTDEEEATLRTNPTLADSDDDGLSDAEEVRVWKSDPLDSDTDNDGFPDGTEVKAGYDPNAPGAKLLTLPPGSDSSATNPAPGTDTNTQATPS